jgi:imidazolonepropionase-like amidohydrolase
MNFELPRPETVRAAFIRKLERWRDATAWLVVGDRLEWRNTQLVSHGPALLLLADTHVSGVVGGADLPADWREIVATALPAARGFDFEDAVAAPGLLEGHAHLFLEYSPGPAETDEQKLHARARHNAAASLRNGVMWLRDCGDPYGINLAVRGEGGPAPAIRACGAAIHRLKRYGKQLGLAVADDAELLAAVRQRIAAGADDIKLVLSGIVNFAKADVPGEPQFSAPVLREVIMIAHDHGRRVVVHASGASATALAAETGVDSIEHGYFISKETLAVVAEKGIAWLPTLAPVYAQWNDAERYGHSPQTRDSLRRILDGHETSISLAAELGVRIAGGSDAGSPGIGHGPGAALEARLLAKVLGPERAYAACSAPGAAILGFDACPALAQEQTSGADFAILPASPADDATAFAHPLAVVRRGTLHLSSRAPAFREEAVAIG